MIKILSSEQLREADQFTITAEPVKSIDLMERAAKEFSNRYQDITGNSTTYIFCGSGNNGGDGLAIARMVAQNNDDVRVFVLDAEKPSEDFNTNLSRLQQNDRIKISYIKSAGDFPSFETGKDDEDKNRKTVIIDAMFGTGLNKLLGSLETQLVEYLNKQNALRVAVDIPTGLFADKYSGGSVFHAHHTITFHSPKLSFLFPGNTDYVGDWSVADIGLDRTFTGSLASNHFILEAEDVRSRIKPRKKFSHKGNFGHALIHAGSNTKMGAAILCAKSCVSTGAGLTTVLGSREQFHSLNVAVPEAITEECRSSSDVDDLDFTKYTAYALGPGIGTDKAAAKTFFALLEHIECPTVFDADALNILSMEKNWWKLILKNSILTPHKKEFDRLAGKAKNWEERHNRQLELSTKQSLYIVYKGAYTCISTPQGKSYFNPTGNPGMAKGGSGDVLTGMIGSLLAQKYSPEDACIIAVYLQGLAADIAVEKESEYSVTASHIIANIGNAFHSVLS